ncbi:unnamed protein product [Pseudo-nitzschia multistriata]|uniref:Methyltransferase type 11 domain-containing protein n=1 Tax=Pseudo-nitzschia multistriata TaxID=183589 RepID=A0A448YW31_9STRA|nr:unnamed protein product [Pseudo-nitzschia multistriata]
MKLVFSLLAIGCNAFAVPRCRSRTTRTTRNERAATAFVGRISRGGQPPSSPVASASPARDESAARPFSFSLSLSAETQTESEGFDEDYDDNDHEARSQFGTKEYWDNMYQGMGDFPMDEYEWYFGFERYWRHVQAHTPGKDAEVLIPGIGNDPVLLDLLQKGYTKLTATDYSEFAIERQRDFLSYQGHPFSSEVGTEADACGSDRPTVLAQMDARRMPEQWTDRFDAILEKGALDAIYLSGDGSAEAAAAEFARVLRPGGILVSVSGVVPADLRREIFGGWEWIRDGSGDKEAGLFIAQNHSLACRLCIDQACHIFETRQQKLLAIAVAPALAGIAAALQRSCGERGTLPSHALELLPPQASQYIGAVADNGVVHAVLRFVLFHFPDKGIKATPPRRRVVVHNDALAQLYLHASALLFFPQLLLDDLQNLQGGPGPRRKVVEDLLLAANLDFRVALVGKGRIPVLVQQIGLGVANVPAASVVTRQRAPVFRHKEGPHVARNRGRDGAEFVRAAVHRPQQAKEEPRVLVVRDAYPDPLGVCAVGPAACDERRGTHQIHFSTDPKLQLVLIQGVLRAQVQFERHLVGAKPVEFPVVLYGKAVVHIRGRLAVLVKGPLGFSGTVVVEHVRVGDQGRGTVAIDLKPKIPRTHAHPCPLEFLQGTNLIQRCNLANRVVVVCYGLVAVLDLLQQVAPGQVLEFLRRPENGHVAERLRQNFVVGVEKRVLPVDLAIPQEINHQENVLRRIEVQVASENGPADRRLLPHLDRDEAPPGDGHADRVGRKAGPGVDAPHLGISLARSVVVVDRHLLLLFLLGLVVFLVPVVDNAAGGIVVLSELELRVSKNRIASHWQ